MKTFNEYLEGKVPGRVVKNFSEMMKLIKSDYITNKDLFEIAECTYSLANSLDRSSNYLESRVYPNSKIFQKLAIDEKAVAYQLYEDTARIASTMYPESSNSKDYLKLMAYCYAVHEELIVKNPLRQSIEQFNALYDEYLEGKI